MPPKSIAALKNLHLTTDLTAGAEIVIPPDPAWTFAANKLQAILRAHTGADLPLVSGETASLSALNERHQILLGSAMNNPALMALYRRKYAFLDDHYPGPGGYVLRTVHNPEGRGHNVLLVGAGRPEDAPAALDRLDALLGDGRPGYLNEARSQTHEAMLPGGGNRPPLRLPHPEGRTVDGGITPEIFREQTEAAFRGNAGRWPIEYGISLGLVHHFTRNSDCAQMFKDVLFYYEDLVKNRYDGEWCFEHMLFIYAWTWRLFYVWDLIEESDAFTDPDRLRMTNLLWGLTSYVANLPYFRGETPPAPEIRQNHATFAALSMSFSAGYFQTYYGINDFPKHLKFCDAIFNGQADCYKPNDDGGGGTYCWLVPNHLMTYDLKRDDFRFLENGHLREIADYAILMTDNLGSQVDFGDTGGYSVPKKTSPGISGILTKAAWYYNDGGYLWALDWMDARPHPETFYRNLPRQLPERMTGVSIAPCTPPLYAWVERHAKANIPIEQSFDKLVLRAGFNPEDEFLYLDGNSTFAHGHEDGNSIERLTWKGRMWLAETDYIWKRPRHHCSVVSICNGESGPMPALTSLRWAEDFGNLAFTRTAVPNYNGVHWTRDLFWLKGRFFLAADSLELLHDADYDLRCLWRTLGSVEQKGGDLTAEQQGVFFRIRNADDSDKTLEDEPLRVADKDPYEGYEFASGPVRIFKQQKTLHGTTGATEHYFNLMLAGSLDDLNAYRIERLAENTVRVTGPDGSTLFGVSSAQRGNLRIQANAFALTETSLTLPGATSLSVNEISLEADRPLHLVTHPIEGKGELRTAAETTIRVRNLPGLRINGAPVTESATVPPGTHELRFDPLPTDELAHALQSGSPYTHKRPPRENRFVPAESSALRETWRASTDGSITRLDAHNGNIAAGTTSGRIALLNANGHILWTHDTGAKIRTVHLAGTSLLAGGEDCALTCLDANGNVQWTHDFIPSHARKQHLNAVATNAQGQIFAATDGWLVWAFTPEGKEIWQRQIEHHAAGSLVVGDVDNDGNQEILVGTEYYHANLLESDGRIRWRTRGGPGYTALALADLNGDGNLESLCGSMDGNVYAVNSTSGNVLWSANLGDNVQHGLALPQGFLAGSESGNLALLGADGQRLWRKDLNAPITGLALLGDTLVAASTAEGWIVLLSPGGDLLGNHRLDAGVTALKSLPNGLLAGTETGQVIALTRI